MRAPERGGNPPTGAAVTALQVVVPSGLLWWCTVQLAGIAAPSKPSPKLCARACPAVAKRPAAVATVQDARAFMVAPLGTPNRSAGGGLCPVPPFPSLVTRVPPAHEAATAPGARERGPRDAKKNSPSLTPSPFASSSSMTANRG